MRNIFIMAHSMEIGGAERSLIGLLETMDYSQYNVDLFLLRRTGELLDMIPKQVNVLEEIIPYSLMGVPIKDAIRKKKFRFAYGRLKGKFLAKKKIKQLSVTGDNNITNEYSHKYTEKYMPQICHKRYDLAVSFMSPHYYVKSKVMAKRKAAWLHTDYSTFAVDRKSEEKMWSGYDDIIAISEGVKAGFISAIPSLAARVKVIENIMPMQLLRRGAESKSVSDEMPERGAFNLLTVGRFSYPKNMDNIPEICSLIRKEGVNVIWYLIGYGGDEALIRRRIIENDMADYVKILGKKDNPYPYMKRCDVYIQPSRYEGKCVAVREAQILEKPVIITAYATAQNQLEDGIDGYIVPLDNAECAKAISRILKKPEELRRLVENEREKDYANIHEIKKVYSLLGPPE